MATISAAETTATVQRSAEPSVQVAVPSRREFLYYVWGASIILLLGEATAALIWFALPRFKEGTFGGIFNFPIDKIPAQGEAPYNEPAGRFWVTQYDSGLAVLFGVCTHLGCLPKWVPNTDRFECPCHGSKYANSGQWLDGPAPRSLDRFPIVVMFSDGTTAVTDTDGGTIPLEGRTITSMRIDTGKRIKMPGRSLPPNSPSSV
jgi:cytochrome b6-f complex iron-sulfur subunit